MRYRVIVLDQAEDDLKSIIQKYREEAPHSVQAFRDELNDVHGMLQEFPHAYEAHDTVFRRVPLHRFPYFIYYRITQLYVEIAAVLPQRFSPHSIGERLSPSLE